MFDEASNENLGGELIKIQNPKFTIICRVGHTVSLFFNYFSMVKIVNQIITYHMLIYRLFWFWHILQTPVLYSNQDLMNFIEVKFSYYVAIIPL